MTTYKQKIDNIQLIFEQTKRIQGFIDTLKQRHQLTPQLEQHITKFIEDSGCQRIDFAAFKHPALGIALSTGVLINQKLLQNPLPHTLFVIFHEIAHQYQFKKYGANTMYQLYIHNLPIPTAAKILRKIEMVADAYAERKIKQLQKMGLLKQYKTQGQYKNLPLTHYEDLLRHLLNDMRTKNIGKTPQQISEYFYNLVKDKPLRIGNLTLGLDDEDWL